MNRAFAPSRRFLFVVVACAAGLVAGCSGGGGGSDGGAATAGSAGPIVTVTATPTTVASGQVSVVSWSSSNASTCEGSNALGVSGGSLPTSGSRSVMPFTNSTYVVTCTNSSGTGQGSVTVSVTVPAGHLPLQRTVIENNVGAWGQVFADFDRDGKVDAVGALGPAGTFQIVWYRNTGTVWQKYVLASVGGGDTIKVADVDKDGCLDVVTTTGVAWFRNPCVAVGADITPLTQPWTRYAIDANQADQDLVIDDVNGDGKLDVITRPNGDGPAVIYLQGADPKVTANWTKVTLNHPNADTVTGVGMTLANIDGQAGPDLVFNGFWLKHPGNANVANPAAWQRVSFIANDTLAALPHSKIAAHDIDADGNVDVVVAPQFGQLGSIIWYKNPGPATVGTNQAWASQVVLNPTGHVHTLLFVDVNNDNRKDLIFGEMHTNPTDKRVGVFFANATAPLFFDPVPQLISNEGSHNVDVADANGDGKIDFLGSNQGTDAPDGGALNVWFGI